MFLRRFFRSTCTITVPLCRHLKCTQPEIILTVSQFTTLRIYRLLAAEDWAVSSSRGSLLVSCMLLLKHVRIRPLCMFNCTCIVLFFSHLSGTSIVVNKNCVVNSSNAVSGGAVYRCSRRPQISAGEMHEEEIGRKLRQIGDEFSRGHPLRVSDTIKPPVNRSMQT